MSKPGVAIPVARARLLAIVKAIEHSGETRVEHALEREDKNSHGGIGTKIVDSDSIPQRTLFVQCHSPHEPITRTLENEDDQARLFCPT